MAQNGWKKDRNMEKVITGKKGELYEIGARLDTVYGKKTGTSEGVFNSDAY